MNTQSPQKPADSITTLDDLARLADFSLMDTLKRDPDAKASGVDHEPRQVFSGHYVPVKPTPINAPEYVAHSRIFFRELGMADSMAVSEDFVRVFSGDLSQVPEPAPRCQVLQSSKTPPSSRTESKG